MNYAKYELRKDNILKDGHTMFLTDAVKDLNRKSFLEKQNKELREKIKKYQYALRKGIDFIDVEEHLKT